MKPIGVRGGKRDGKSHLSSGRILFLITLSEIVLLGTGRVISLYGMPLRWLLFLLNFYVFVLCVFLRRRFPFPNQTKISVFFVLTNLVVWGLFLSIINGNGFHYAFADSNGLVCLLYTLPWFCFAFYEKWSFRFVVNSFTTLTFVLSLGANLVILLYMLGYVNLYRFAANMRNLNFEICSGLMPGGFPRIYLPQSLLYLPACLFLFSELIWRGRLSILKYVMLTSIIMGLLFSYARGLWLGFVFGVVVLFIASAQRIPVRKYFVRITLLLVLPVFLLGLGNANNLKLLRQRFLSTWDTTNDVSNVARFAQVSPLLDQWQKYPLWGKGYGATVEGLVRSKKEPYSFELVPFSLLMKLGVLGVMWWAIYFLQLMIASKASNNKRERTLRTTWVRKAIFSSIAAVIISSMTNPYLLNSVGMGIIAIFVLILEIDKTTQRHQPSIY